MKIHNRNKDDVTKRLVSLFVNLETCQMTSISKMANVYSYNGRSYENDQIVTEEFQIVLRESSQTRKQAYYSFYIQVQNKKKTIMIKGETIIRW